jgi:acetylornithine deacetylase
MSETARLLRALVALDTTSTRSNLPLIELVEAHARRLGFETRRQAWTDAAGVAKANLIARRGPQRAGGLALVGHTDCVPYDAGWAGALLGEERDGNLYGRGAADTKAFIAAALRAAERVPSHREPLWLVFTADEEVGCLGAKRLLEEGAVRPEKAIVGEPTRLIPVRAHKGYGLAEVEVRGQEAHSAFPELGASAILGAARLLRALEEAMARLAAERDPQFAPPYTSFNVGLIQGGKAKNVVAGACSFTLEWRPIPGQDVRRALSLVEEVCAAAAVESGGRLSATVRASRLDAGVSVPAGADLVRFLEQESARPSETIPFGTELPQLVALGAEACVFGPGDIRVAHKTGEFVPLAELAEAERILARAIERFCG